MHHHHRAAIRMEQRAAEQLGWMDIHQGISYRQSTCRTDPGGARSTRPRRQSSSLAPASWRCPQSPWAGCTVWGTASKTSPSHQSAVRKSWFILSIEVLFGMRNNGGLTCSGAQYTGSNMLSSGSKLTPVDRSAHAPRSMSRKRRSSSQNRRFMGLTSRCTILAACSRCHGRMLHVSQSSAPLGTSKACSTLTSQINRAYTHVWPHRHTPSGTQTVAS